MASLGLSEREQAGCRQILELLETEELLALTDTVTNRLVHPENRQGVRIPLRRAAFRPVAPISERGSGRLPSCLSAAEGLRSPGPCVPHGLWSAAAPDTAAEAERDRALRNAAAAGSVRAPPGLRPCQQHRRSFTCRFSSGFLCIYSNSDFR